jgi:hypothetical protein
MKCVWGRWTMTFPVVLITGALTARPAPPTWIEVALDPKEPGLNGAAERLR